MTTWGERTTKDLVEYMSATMPPGRPSLAEAEYLNITAFILQFNGATAGAQPLVAATATPIGTIATGQRAAAPRPTPAGADGAGPAGRARGRAARRAGMSVTRRNEELRAGDRRDAAQSAAGRLADGAPELSGVELQPARRDHARQREGVEAGVELGDERSRRQPADAAGPQRHHVSRQHRQHDAGARCRHRRADLGEPGRAEYHRGFGAVRNIAIYGDKVFMATNDARLVAFDARTGKVAWDTPIADRTKRLSPTPAARSSSAAR